MKAKEIAEVLAWHQKWLNGDDDGVRADFSGRDLRDCDLTWCDLTGADFRWADLRGADFIEANLTGADLPHFGVCPEEGDFIGWKKLRGDVICKLLIPAEAKRTSCLTARKCRAEFVKVIEGEGFSLHYRRLKYSPGQTVRPDSYNDDIRLDCANGIHFFITRREAEEWCLWSD
jgi:hypothetical protein